MTVDDARTAYALGWEASRITKTGDLDAAEARYLRRHGHVYVGDWLAGWSDYAADAPKWSSYA